MQFVVVRVSASLSWERRSYIVQSARRIGVPGSALHGEGAGVGGVGNGGGVCWPCGALTAGGWGFACGGGLVVTV